MTVWYHQSTILKCKIALRIAGLIAVCVAIITTLFLNSATYAAPGINQTLSFQGRLLTSTGGVVADGYYNIQFKIYKGGTASGGGTEQWSESYVNNSNNEGVNVKNGYFSLNLGSKTALSSVDWNDDTLYLSMNIAGNSPSCSNFSSCSPDGEMTPMKRITSVPFAINSAQLGGRTADGFIQNGTSPQTADFNITGTGTAANLQAASLDTASAGALTLGGTNATSITMADDVTIAAGKSLTLAGGTTANRPASPSEGTLWFDTDLKKLVIYADGKWAPIGSDSKTATKIVAASNSPAEIKASADYVADGTGDQTEINAALTAAAGGKVYLAEGTYTVSDTISIPNNTTLAGAGAGTSIQFTNISGQTKNMITNTDTSTGASVVIRELQLNGRNDLNTSGTQIGIYLNGMGGGTTRQGVSVLNINVLNFRSHGMYIESSANGTITGSLFQGNVGSGIDIGSLHRSTITNNTFVANTIWGVRLGGSNGTVVSTNAFASNGTIAGSLAGGGILLNGASGTNTIIGNSFRDNTASTANSTIAVDNASANTITGNSLYDSAGSGYAIYLTANAGQTVLNANVITGTVTGINDLSTSTVYSGQLDNTGKIINKSSAGTTVQASTNTTTAFQVQNATGSNVLQIDTTNSRALVAGALDTTTATALTLGATTATSVSIGNASGNVLTTLNGRTLIKSTAGNNSTTAFQVQNAAATALLTADTTNMQVVIGSGGNTITLSSSGIALAGNARGTKQIRLAAEYQNAVLDNGSTGNNSGTMTSSLDLTNRMNFYRWTATPATAQSYDIVVQVPIPQDFSAWAASNPLSITSRTDSTADGTMTMEVRDSSNTVICNFVSVSMGTANSWITNTPSCLSSGTYTPGDYLTIRLRPTAKNSAKVDIGNIMLNYLSSK